MFPGSRKTPNIGHHVGYPPVGIVKDLCCFATRFRKPFGHLNEGPVQFRQIGDFSRPVIHLNVDVEVIIAVPGCLDSLCP